MITETKAFKLLSGLRGRKARNINSVVDIIVKLSKMVMKEKDMQTLFTKWLKKYGTTGAYELKICKKKSMPFNKVEEHQVDALLKSRNGIYAYKISIMRYIMSLKSILGP